MSTKPIARARAAALVAALVAGSTLVGSGDASAACAPAAGIPIRRAPDPVPEAQVVFRGWGWGHGLGMSQYGAQGAARLGCSAAQILSTYYRGTSLSSRSDRPSIGVRLLDNVRGSRVTVVSGSVGWRNGRTTIARQRSGFWRVRWLSATQAELLNGRSVVWRGTVHVNGLRAVIGNSVVALDAKTDTYGKLPMQLKYDDIRFTVSAAGLDVVKWFFDGADGRGIDQYLYGLAEVPSSWPAQALQAQAIAARTYAYKKNAIMLPTPQDQNYEGYDQEASDLASGGRLRAAVVATSGRVVVDSSGRPIDAVYSSSMGGRTEDKVYSWGGAPVPYLRSVDDSAWDRASDNPPVLQAWTKGFTRRQIATAFGFTRLTRISVPGRGTARRLEGVRIEGLKQGVPTVEFVPGFTVRNKLGLLSPGFHILMN